MTTVLPAWKKELIEKKKKKDREEKQKLQEESARIEQIPEWKRALLQKRCAQTTSVAPRPQQTSSSQNILNGNSSSHMKVWSPPANSFVHSDGNRYVIEHNSSHEKPSTNKQHSDRAQDKMSPKECINNGEINSFVTTFVDPCKEDNSLPLKELTVTSNSEMEEDVYSKPTDNAVNGLNHADIKLDCESKENLARSDNVDYEHVRPPSEIRRLFEKPKVQIVSENDKSEKSNERITSYTKEKLNKRTDNFKTRDVYIDRSVQEIDQDRFKNSCDNRKLIKQKLPDSKADAFSTDIDVSQISEKTKNASNSTAGNIASSTVGSYTKLCASPFTPTSNNSFKPSSQFPWQKSSFVVEKSKDVGFQSKEKKQFSQQKYSDINKSCCEGTKDANSPQIQNLTPYPVQNFEKEKQDNTAILETQSSPNVQNSDILSGSEGIKFESRTDNISDQVEISAHVQEKLNDSQKVDDLQLNRTESNEKHTSTSSVVSQLTKHSGKGPEMSRRPRLQKRWSADVATMLSLQKSNEELLYRSPSQSEIAEENMDWTYLFRHRPSVSEGIERRMSKLKRQVSHSEEDENEETSEQLKPIEGDDDSSQQRQQKTTRARPASWHSPDDFLFNIEESSCVNSPQVARPRVSSDANVPFAHKQPISESIERRVGELVRHSSTPDLFATIIDSNKEVRSSVEHSTDTEIDKESEKSKTSEMVISGIENEKNEEKDFETNAKPSKGSVHKLSALFGSSIFKSNKKEKSKDESKADVIKSHKNEKQEKKMKNKDLMKAKEETKVSPSLFRKVFKNENKTTKAKTNENGVKPDVHTIKLETKETIKPISTINGPSSFPAKLRHVSGQEKQKVKRTIGMMDIMVDDDIENVKPGSKQSNLWPKSSTPPRVVDIEKSKVIIDQKSIPQVNEKEISSDNISTSDLFKMNGTVNPTQHSPDYQTSSNADNLNTASNNISVSVIDMPDPLNNDVEVSVIDIPRSPTLPDVEVSAIDLPESPDAPEISVIDMPEPEEKTETQNHSLHQVQVFNISDDSDDSDSDDETMGSYDVTTVIDGDDNEPFAVIEGQSFRNDIDEKDEDDAQLATVPIVIFENALPSNLISSMSNNRKRKKPTSNRKINFQENHTIHHYLSEEAMTVEFDEMERKKSEENKMTLSSYQPTLLTKYKKSLDDSQQQEMVQNSLKWKEKELESKSSVLKTETQNTTTENEPKQITEITYKEEGSGFTDSSDNAGALLF